MVKYLGKPRVERGFSVTWGQSVLIFVFPCVFAAALTYWLRQVVRLINYNKSQTDRAVYRPRVEAVVTEVMPSSVKFVLYDGSEATIEFVNGVPETDEELAELCAAALWSMDDNNTEEELEDAD